MTPGAQPGVGGISADKLAELFQLLGEMKSTQKAHGDLLVSVHKTLHGNGEPGIVHRMDAVERQLSLRHTISAGIAGFVSMAYHLGMTIFSGSHKS